MYAYSVVARHIAERGIAAGGGHVVISGSCVG